MDSQDSTAKSDLERMLFVESMEAKALPLSLLKHITGDFSDDLEIGRGGFAVVYKGLLDNGAVAVKKLSEASDIDEKKFHREVECLMKAKHKNIVRFLGYCSDTQGLRVEHNGKSIMADVRQRLLCFEYLPNGSLDKYIKDASLEWGKCYQIIKGVCEGLCYLHQKQIVHSDLKPANILLDDDMVPKIADFGISRCFDGKQTHAVTQNIIGSMGYLSLEVIHHGKISTKSDIFSLGVIIVEILTANKNCAEDRIDVEEVLECWRHKVEKSHEEQQLEQIKVCTELGKRCLEYDPAKRPCAQGIINALEQTESKEQSIEGTNSKSDLERMLFDESMEAKALPLSLLACITDGFSDNREIGRGGSAVVYKGLLENGAVAVKKLSPTSDINENFEREFLCLMKVKHKNIIRFLGYFSDKQEYSVYNGKSDTAICQRLLCFEYLPKGNLNVYIKDSSREWGKCYQIIKGVCEGLHYLHKERIVHSDLEPANILLDNDMVPKIIDFGISRCFDEDQTCTFTSKILGSMEHLAPESYSGKFSFKSDIYSLGVIITEILTAEKGYPVIENVLKYWRHKVEKSQEEQIRVCTELGKRCMEYDPASRPRAQDIIHILEQIGETGATVPQPFKYRSTVEAINVARTCKAVTQAICKFYSQNTADVSVEGSLCRDAYITILLKGGEQLYSAMETAMTSNVRSLCGSLEAAAEKDMLLFLQELLAKWHLHIRAVDLTRDMLMYMDQTFVVTNGKTPIYELGLRLWLGNMTSSNRIRPRLIEAARPQNGSDFQRKGGGEDELVAGVKRMLTELGAEVIEVPWLFFQDGAGKLQAAGP